MRKFILIVAAFAAESAFAGQPSVLGDLYQDNRMLSFEKLDLANYYEQYLFKVLGDCKEISTVSFQSFSTHDEPMIGQDSKARDVYAGIKFNLFADGTYWGEYREAAVIERQPNAIRFDPLFNSVIQGKWQVAGDKIVVQDIGEGSPVTVNGVSKVMFKFSKALNDQRIVGTTGVMGRVITNSGPHGESINQYCGLGQ